MGPAGKSARTPPGRSGMVNERAARDCTLAV